MVVQIFVIFTLNPGEDEPNLTVAYVSNGLKLNHQLDWLIPDPKI